MFQRFSRSDTLFCFSPTVMLATAIIELFLAAYVFIRFRMTQFGRLATVALISLGLFQVAEYQICAGANNFLWAQIGLISATFLPALGIHLISLLTGKNLYVRAAYSFAVLYAAIFLFAPEAINGATCSGNYIIFNTAIGLGWAYAIYYFGFLMLGLWEIIDKIKKSGKEDFSALFWMFVGYSSFMIPMGIAYSLSEPARNAIPSIMCGFAVIFAVILALIIVPKFHNNK